MSGAEELFERVANAPTVPSGIPLVVLLTGFTDAGGAVSGLIEHLYSTRDPEPVVIFENDRLLDYRARRPIITFDQDHLTELSPHRLELSLVHDTIGQPFLLLSGYEPDFAWNAFTRAVLDLADEFQVSGLSWLHAIAMPVPHTRPLGTTVSGNREELIEAYSIWKPRTQVPATVGHLIEYRFAERSDRVVGFVLLVPHYLADTENPEAVLAGADRLMSATGLVLNVDAVRERTAEYVERVNEQVAASEELQQMLHALESRHDAYMAALHAEAHDDQQDPLFTERNLPSADELAAELERYLANRQPGDDDKGRGRNG